MIGNALIRKNLYLLRNRSQYDQRNNQYGSINSRFRPEAEDDTAGHEEGRVGQGNRADPTDG